MPKNDENGKIEHWLNENSVQDVEIQVSDLAGISRGKKLTSNSLKQVVLTVARAIGSSVGFLWRGFVISVGSIWLGIMTGWGRIWLALTAIGRSPLTPTLSRAGERGQSCLTFQSANEDSVGAVLAPSALREPQYVTNNTRRGVWQYAHPLSRRERVSVKTPVQAKRQLH